MARIAQRSVEEVKAAADIVAVVSGRTQLRRVGARFTGRCPFHEERTPSFSVNAQEKLFYCFGCGKGGDVVSFVQETESVDFAASSSRVNPLAIAFRPSVVPPSASPSRYSRQTASPSPRPAR